MLWLVAAWLPTVARAQHFYGPVDLSHMNFQETKEAAGQFQTRPVTSAGSVSGEAPPAYPMNFVKIKRGRFVIGTTEVENAQSPSYSITVADFYIGDTAVTVAQYSECVKKKVCPEHSTNSFGDSEHCNYAMAGRQNYPINCVSWEDAQDFIRYLNSKGDGHKYRLPSEAEWEYAATGGRSQKFHWGKDDPDWSIAFSKTTVGTADVHSAPAVRFLYGMSGHMREWVQDRYHESYEGIPADGRAWEEGTGSHRVVCGGFALNVELWRVQSSYRHYGAPDLRLGDIGFRLVRN